MPLSRRAALPLLGIAATAPAATTILIRNCYLFDGTGSARTPRNVRITGDRIDAISAGDIPVPAGATVIDGAGHTLMPGLTDAHWHMSAVKGASWMGPEDAVSVALIFKDAEQQLMRGFTTVRDTAGSIFGIRDAIERGIMPGPRCYPIGAAISQTSGHADFDPVDELPPTLNGGASRYRRSEMTAVANGVPEVLAAARQQFKRGATQIKIMAGGGLIVVGVGYPTDQAYDMKRRLYDLTPAWPAAMPPAATGGFKAGGNQHFARFLLDQLRPEIAKRYKVAPDRQSLFGHSLGGLFALHLLYTRPNAFEAIIAASPSQWWNDQSLLTEERDFTDRLTAGKIAGRVSRLLLLTGERDAAATITWDAEALVRRLEPLSGYGLRTRFANFDGETHISVPYRAITPTLRFVVGVP